jgi:cytochrome c-type biogenesis protein CcmH
MKLNLYLNKLPLILFLLCILSVLFAKNASADIESDLKKISLKLRCMTCQNQTIYDSDSDFSKDIKNIIKEKLKNNENQKEILNFLIQRYGEYIVFEPQMNVKNIFLWYFPFIILALSLVFLFFRIKKN